MKKILIKFAALVIICCTLFGCKPEEEKLGTIYGTVTDFATGDPVINANIQLRPSGETTLTGYDGMYEFRDLSAGRYSLSFSKAEYLDLNDDYVVELAAGKTIRRDVQMQKQVASLLITDTDGHAMSTLDFGSEESVTSKAFNVFNNGTVSISCQLSFTCEWIVSVSTPPNIIYPGQTVNVTVVINRSNLSAGQNTTFLHISSNNGNGDLQITAIGESAPAVYMSSVSSVGYVDATLSGKILEEGLPRYTECGFVIGENTLPTISESLQTITLEPSTSAVFSRNINNLRPCKTYFVRAYATNVDGTVYSNELQFTTRTPEDPAFLTLAPKKVYETGATMCGYVQTKGDPAFITKGFVVSFSNNHPVIDNCDGAWTISGTQTGVFTLGLHGFPANSINYVRAFAITPYDTVYYNVVSFETRVPYVILGNLAVRLEDEYYVEEGLFSYNMSHYAANQDCENLVLGSYEDWRLPTSAELKLMYDHRNEIGGFSAEKYWTSTKNKDEEGYEGSLGEGYVSINFANGQINYGNPYASFVRRVRAVRSLY